jgi:hypothetical protein
MANWQEVNGIYGANIPEWDDALYEKVKLGRFRWAIVRLDTKPEVAKRLHEMGLRVIVQAEDVFNNRDTAPWVLAQELWDRAKPFHDWSEWIILDNEPNLNCQRNSWWWAGQWTRWYRSVMSDFRYLDSWTGWWRIIHPALCQGEGSNWEQWLEISRENWQDADAVSAHSYWQTDDTYDSPKFGRSWKAIRDAYPYKELFITEYAPDIIWLSPQERARRMVRFLSDTALYARACFYFILGGTGDWRRYHLSRETAIELGRMA